MNAHTLSVLEFDSIKEILSAKARSPLGRARALSMVPSTDIDEIVREMDRVTELGLLLDSGDFRLGEIHDIGGSLDRCASEGSVLEPTELYRVAHTARTARLASIHFSKNKERHPLLSELASQLASFEEMERAIFKSVNEEGELLDSASAELASIRRRRERLRESIRRNLTNIMVSNENLLQEKLITLRQERYVIPIKSEGKGRMQCIVHDISGSGATLFVEPLAVIESNNELQENRKQEQEEIRRVLMRLSRMAREDAADLEISLSALAHLDLLHAKVSFADEFRCVRPDIDSSGKMTLRGGVHPLLARKKGFDSVVPLDLSLGDGYDTLLISGPNAGGKTVALKTVGVLALLSQCGMHVPATPGTRFSVFKDVYADIGDEQSIERDLSTFSSHMNNIIEILEGSDSSSLVLLDEVGVGTDPRSGTGIAMAVLSELTRRGARTLATSHYGELKIFAEAAEGMKNASVESDPETLQPTYRLKMGIPGSSNTFEIAEKLGMNQKLLDEARKYSEEGSSRAEEIITSLERSLSQSERLSEEARLEGARLRRLASEYEQRLLRIRAQEKDARTRRREQARKLIEDARSTVENLVREIRESQADREFIKRAKRTLSEQLERHAQPEVARDQPREALKEGDTVFVEPFKARGRVKSLSRTSVKVEVGRITCEVPLSSVSRSEPQEPEQQPPVRTSEPSASFELNLIGRTRDEALQALDKHIDTAFMSGLTIVRIVHGKGEGVLKRAVEESLKADSRIEAFREGLREEGGWGVTIAKLKT